MRYLLLVVLLAALGGAALAQGTFPEREIITVLKMGENVFELDWWRASASETGASTTASWQSTPESGFSGVSFINYLHFDTGYNVEELDALFNDEWFAQTFAGWEELRKTNVCFDGDVTLHEFTLAYREASGSLARYALRYWVDPVSETRVRAWHVAFATTYSDGSADPRGRQLLDDYAARIYPDLISCGR